jgi:hypothetical protein
MIARNSTGTMLVQTIIQPRTQGLSSWGEDAGHAICQNLADF